MDSSAAITLAPVTGPWLAFKASTSRRPLTYALQAVAGRFPVFAPVFGHVRPVVLGDPLLGAGRVGQHLHQSDAGCIGRRGRRRHDGAGAARAGRNQQRAFAVLLAVHGRKLGAGHPWRKHEDGRHGRLAQGVDRGLDVFGVALERPRGGHLGAHRLGRPLHFGQSRPARRDRSGTSPQSASSPMERACLTMVSASWLRTSRDKKDVRALERAHARRSRERPDQRHVGLGQDASV